MSMSKNSVMTPISDVKLRNALRFDNKNIRTLPIDSISENFCRQVPNAVFSMVKPATVKNPHLISMSPSALNLLGINVESCDSNDLAALFSGNVLFEGSETYAHCYCGHQFGSFAGQLGDGAAISLGEVINSAGDRWELQLKGAGKTPYSRNADGRKVLRSTIREYLCSEAMHFIGIPTTRAAACVTSDSTVQRDPMYDGNVIDERCTVVARIAPCFFRIGSFEIFKIRDTSDSRSGPSAGNIPLLRQLTDHVIESYYSTLWTLSNRYRALLDEVVDRTARLAAMWQTVGFVHGVLNTDNLSVVGVTIDYGPFGFMEHFDPDFVPNGSDGSGRYSYAGQPEACKWALLRFAEALGPLFAAPDGSDGSDSDSDMESVRREVSTRFDALYSSEYDAIMRRKLGFLTTQPGDDQLIADLFSTMQATSTDFTDTFRALTRFASEGGRVEDQPVLIDRLVSRAATPETIVSSLRRKIRISRPSMPPQQTMYLWELLQGDPQKVQDMFSADVDVIRAEIESEKRKLDGLMATGKRIEQLRVTSAADKTEQDRRLWSPWIERYALRLRAEMVGDSAGAEAQTQRVEMMANSNPAFVLRNWVAQEAIAAAEKGDFSGVNTVLRMLSQPYNSAFDAFSSTCDLDEEASLSAPDTRKYLGKPPDWAASLICTCSS